MLMMGGGPDGAQRCIPRPAHHRQVLFVSVLRARGESAMMSRPCRDEQASNVAMLSKLSARLLVDHLHFASCDRRRAVAITSTHSREMSSQGRPHVRRSNEPRSTSVNANLV